MDVKKPLVRTQDKRLRSFRQESAGPIKRSAGTSSDQILLLILKWACFAITILLILAVGLPFAHIEDSAGSDLHGDSPFCKSSCSWVLNVLYHKDSDLSFNLWLKLGYIPRAENRSWFSSSQSWCGSFGRVSICSLIAIILSSR